MHDCLLVVVFVKLIKHLKVCDYNVINMKKQNAESLHSVWTIVSKATNRVGG